MDPGPLGAHVQKARVATVAGRQVALLQVRVPGETLHVVVAEGLGTGLVDAEQRARLRDAMAVAARPGSASGEALAAEAAEALRNEPREALEERGGRIVEAVAHAGVEGRREALARAISKAIARVERRAEAVRGDLARAQASDEAAQRAQLFVAEAARAPRGATRLVAVDWTSGEPREAELPLDPARGAREQIDALFRKARRRKEGARIALARLADAEQALRSLRSVAAAVAEGASADLDALEKRAHAAAPRDFKRPPTAQAVGPGGKKPPAQPALPPYRTFLASSGARILVGRGAEKNDALTFHVARPHDLWLHAKNRTGAHVIVPLDRGASCPADALVDAAHLAAHFSDARDEPLVEVQHTPRRYLRKPRGSAPGLVVVDREKVLVLRRQDDRLRALLEREVDPAGETTVTVRPRTR